MPADKTPISRLKMLIEPLRVEQGMSIPWIYGYSYFDGERGVIVAYIIPLNIIVVFGMWLRALLRYRVARWFARKYEAIISSIPR